MVTASIITTGNELLSGRTADANTPYIASRLSKIGIRTVESRTIPDIVEDISKTVNELRKKTDYLFTTGGLGPTHDDVTTKAIAKAFGAELELNEEAHENLLEYYKKNGSKITGSIKKMATVPKGAEIITNPINSTIGYRIENTYVLAGIPIVVQSMVDKIIPDLDLGKRIMSNTVTCSLRECEISEKLAELNRKHDNVDIGSYPHFRGGRVGLSIVLRSHCDESIDIATQSVISLVESMGSKPDALSVLSSGNSINTTSKD